MVEAMYEFSPEYFKKIQKPFRYFTCNQLPDFTSSRIKNFAYGSHSSSTRLEHCSIEDLFHYHVIMDGDSQSDFFKTQGVKPYSVPCLLSCYKALICAASDTYFSGEIMDKLQKALEFFDSRQSDMFSSHKITKKSLPQVHTIVKKRCTSTQTTFIPRNTLDRMYQLLSGPNSTEFLLIMDIFESGFGALNIDTDALFINFDLENKIGKKYANLLEI